jgi:hypothetical protein
VNAPTASSGLLLANDLAAARAMIALDDAAGAEEKMGDRLVFVTSERYVKLRKQLGGVSSSMHHDANVTVLLDFPGRN